MMQVNMMKPKASTSTTQPPLLVVVIPMLPPKECSPNWRGHWRVKAKAVRSIRTATMLIARSAINKHRGWTPRGSCNISVTFHVKDRRFVKDDDNARATLKPVVDGLVDARVIDKNDRHVKVISVSFFPYSHKAPLTVLEIYE